MAGADLTPETPLPLPVREPRRAPLVGTVETAAGLWFLFAETVRGTLQRPFAWREPMVAESAQTLRRCLVPLLLSMSFFSVGLLITAVGGALQVIGTIDRLGGGFGVALVREVSFWITSMVFAGVVGSAVTADLGARKIREELDALAVLGVDRVRMLVVPRVLALTLMAPVLGLIALGSAVAVLTVVAPLIVPNLTSVDMVSGVRLFQTVGDLVSLVLKLLVCGVIVSVVCCYKGLTCSGGTEGVGRAVNQAVLINFLALWSLNSLWNAAFLAMFPDIQILRG